MLRRLRTTLTALLLALLYLGGTSGLLVTEEACEACGCDDEGGASDCPPTCEDGLCCPGPSTTTASAPSVDTLPAVRPQVAEFADVRSTVADGHPPPLLRPPISA